MRVLALLGASGHGKVVADAALAAGWESVVFFDDAWPKRQDNGPWKVVGDSTALLQRALEFDGVLVAIGNCAVRVDKQVMLKAAGAQIATIIHPRACVSRFAVVGAGSVVLACAVVNAAARLGDATIINTGASVDHDCFLEQGVHVSPGARLSGDVSVGSTSWIGVGAAIRQGIRIGAGAMVGAGAVVVKPVGDGMTVVGNPARPLRRR